MNVRTMPRSRVVRPKKEQHSVYLTAEDYQRFIEESITASQNFSDWARQAMQERWQREHKVKRSPLEKAQSAVYVSPSGTITWKALAKCYCGECHNPFVEHPTAFLTQEEADDHAQEAIDSGVYCNAKS